MLERGIYARGSSQSGSHVMKPSLARRDVTRTTLRRLRTCLLRHTYRRVCTQPDTLDPQQVHEECLCTSVMSRQQAQKLQNDSTSRLICRPPSLHWNQCPFVVALPIRPPPVAAISAGLYGPLHAAAARRGAAERPPGFPHEPRDWPQHPIPILFETRFDLQFRAGIEEAEVGEGEWVASGPSTYSCGHRLHLIRTRLRGHAHTPCNRRAG